jgi:hypothetical protein
MGTQIDIVNQGSTGGIAAQLCDSLTIGIVSVWYLPSSIKLQYMYSNFCQNGIGGFAAEPTAKIYWSSSEYSGSGAYLYWFNGGGAGATPKTELGRVRAVQYF